ncbi:MAG: HDOD domain-containing protein [Thiobacillus sp.]|nr:HDOD domain-containing protein [Thiobacillus sp.]
MSEADDNRLIDAILASGVKIPPMPTVLLDVLSLAGDDDAGPREYAQAIGHDPAMTGAIFRVVGSPVMGLRVKVDSLEKAITVLGLSTTVAVVRSEAMRGALHDPALEAVMHTLWQRMTAVADLVLAAVRTARLRGVREDIAYQAGIFHDCGVAVLCRRDPAYALAFKDPAGWPDLAALDAAHHANHAVVGLMVARNWQLPQEVAETIRQHHAPRPESLAEPVRNLSALVQFACHLLAARTGADDREWREVWRPYAEAMFGRASMELPELESELLGRVG